MTEENEISEEQRQAVREKYGAGSGKGTAARNSSLSALGTVSVIGFVLAVIGMIVVMSAETITTITLWGGIANVGLLVGFFSLIVYLGAKAVITSRK